MSPAGLRPFINRDEARGQCGAVSRTLPRRGGRHGAQCVGSYETVPHVGSLIAALGRALPAGSALDREGRAFKVVHFCVLIESIWGFFWVLIIMKHTFDMIHVFF